MEVISVIVPFYKGNKYIKRLRFMLEENAKRLQDQAGLELILVNDSPGYSVDVDHLISPSYKTSVFEENSNGGIHKARVDGISRANGDYIIMLDQDDIISGDAMVSLYFAIKDTQFDCVFGNGLFDHAGQTKIILDSYGKTLAAKDRNYYLAMGNRLSSPGQCIIRKDSIPELWKTNILTTNCSDDLFLWILLFKKNNVDYMDKSIYYHVDTGDNVSRDVINGVRSDYEMLSYIKNDGSISAIMQKIFKMRCDYRLRSEKRISLFHISCFYPLIRIIYFSNAVIMTMSGKLTGKSITVKNDMAPFDYALERELA